MWREANIARGAPHGPERTARIRAKLSDAEVRPLVALRPRHRRHGRWPSPADTTTASAISIHRSIAPAHFKMVFVRPAEQAQGVGLSLVLHLLDVGRSLGYLRVGVWTAESNTPARKLYQRAGMTLSGSSAPVRSE